MNGEDDYGGMLHEWTGRIGCGCGSLSVYLHGPDHLFSRKATMVGHALEGDRGFREENGKLICAKCGQEIIVTRSVPLDGGPGPAPGPAAA